MYKLVRHRGTHFGHCLSIKGELTFLSLRSSWVLCRLRVAVIILLHQNSSSQLQHFNCLSNQTAAGPLCQSNHETLVQVLFFLPQKLVGLSFLIPNRNGTLNLLHCAIDFQLFTSPGKVNKYSNGREYFLHFHWLKATANQILANEYFQRLMI